MFFKKYGDIVVSTFYVILAAAIIIMARMLPVSTVTSLGPDFMPTVIGVVTLILALVLLVRSIKEFKNPNAKTAEEEEEDADYKRVISSFIVVVAYVMILKPIGFIISTIVYLPIQMFILSPEEGRNGQSAVKLTLLSVIFTLVVFFLFRYGFKIILPSGIFTINL
ncbi:MAG: tripartite tricarboxylate transporter TctB family protein [Lachnospiraceae bacterium]